MSIYRSIPEQEYKNLEARILYEDNHIIVFNKRAGEIVQGDKTGDEPLSETLKAFIAQRDGKPGQVFMGVPHRLDRPVSGVCLFAKTSKALERLNQMLRDGDIHKTYWALTATRPPKDEATLTDFLVRNEKQNKSYVAKTARRQSSSIRSSRLRTAISFLRYSCLPAVTTRYAASLPIWAVPSRETSSTGQSVPTRTAAYRFTPAVYSSSTPSKRPGWMSPRQFQRAGKAFRNSRPPFEFKVWSSFSGQFCGPSSTSGSGVHPLQSGKPGRKPLRNGNRKAPPYPSLSYSCSP